MSQRTALWSVACAAALYGAGAPPAALAHNAKLNTPYPYTVGDDIARRMQGIFRIVAGLEGATLVYYDRESKNVVAEIIGSAEAMDGAKREIEGFVEAIRAGVVSYTKKRHKIDLTDNDVTLIYYNDGDEDVPIEIVRRENGEYVIPPENKDNE